MYRLFLVLLLITVFSFTAFAAAELEPAAKDKAGNIEEQIQPATVKARIDAYQASRGRALLNEGFEID